MPDGLIYAFLNVNIPALFREAFTPLHGFSVSVIPHAFAQFQMYDNRDFCRYRRGIGTRQNTLTPLCTGKLPVHNNVVTFHPFLLFPVLSLSSLRSGKDGIRYSVPVWHKFRFRVFADSSVTLLTDIQPFVVDE